MRHSRLLSLSLLLLLQQAAWAGPRSYRQALAIAEQQAAQMGISITQQARARAFSDVSSAAGAKSSQGDASSAGTSSAGAPTYYVFPYGDNQGFAIVSGDDQMPELVAYSDKGTIDEQHMSEGCRAFLSAYKQMAEAVVRGDAKALRFMAERRGYQAATEVQHPVVAPLLGDIQWNQGQPYNDLCPYNEEKQQRCYTGCGATAMAQILRYWQYPQALQQDIPAYTSQTSYSDETYDIPQINKGETYDWANMLPQYTQGGYTDEQAQAVAKLMYHCGASLEMMYSVEGSGVLTVPASRFTKYFGFDADLAANVHRDSYSYAEWCQLINRELEARRPVIYEASMVLQGGHVFVCDGADGQGLYHINWGWSGISDGYFDITLLHPENFLDRPGFTFNNSMVIGLQPDNGVKDEPLVDEPLLTAYAFIDDFSIVNGSRANASEPFTASFKPRFYYFYEGRFNGIISIGMQGADGQYVPVANQVEVKGDEEDVDTYVAKLEEVTYQISYAFPVGAINLHTIYSQDGGKTWKPCYELIDEKLRLTATQTTLAMAEDNTDFDATLEAEGDFVANQATRFTYTMTNKNEYDYEGLIDVYVSRTPQKPEQVLYEDYVYIPSGTTTKHVFAMTALQAGDYYFWLYDAKHDKVLVDAKKIVASSDPSTGISAVPVTDAVQGLRVSAGKGSVRIHSAQWQMVPIYDLSGRCIRRIPVQAGVSTSVSLPSGIYIVGAQRVVVR